MGQRDQTTFLVPARLMRALPAVALACALVACAEKAPDYYAGYAEADYVRLASPIGGTLARLHLAKGDQASAGAAAFVLEDQNERAARDEANSRVEQAQAQLDDLTKGRRPDEIAAARAQLVQAEAQAALSVATLIRQQRLAEVKFVAPLMLDEARAAAERDRARVNELRAQLRLARLGAREDAIAAAGQELKAAQAQLAQSNWRLEQKALRVPQDARVVDVLYRVGELVAPGNPVVTLLPAANIKARFFVPQPVLGRLALGQAVTLRCDGCGAPVAARVSFIAREAEYTSPLIYSKENRSALVFMAEATPAPADAARLHPGQPLEIRLSTGGAAP